MIKKIALGILCAVPAAYADWIDDLVPFAENNTLDQLRAEQTILQYIDQDKRAIELLEKKADSTNTDSFWGTVQGGTYQVKWTAAQASLNYHKKVFEFISSLPRNERDKIHFIDQLQRLKKHQEELISLKEEFKKAVGIKASLLSAAYITAKELQIKGRKAVIKSSFII